MKRIQLIVGLGLLSLGFFAVSSYIFFPTLWFDQRVETRNITVYYDIPDKCMNRSKEDIKAEINDKTNYLYKHCLYADSTIDHQIVFYKNRLIHLIFSFFTSENNLGFCLVGLNRQIFIYKADFCTGNLEYDAERGPLSNYLYNRDKIMVHELVHSCMVAKLGNTNYRKLPKWLLEGYAEHIAHQSEDLCNYQEAEYPYQPFYIQMENELTKHDGKINELVNTFLK